MSRRRSRRTNLALSPCCGIVYTNPRVEKRSHRCPGAYYAETPVHNKSDRASPSKESTKGRCESGPRNDPAIQLLLLLHNYVAVALSMRTWRNVAVVPQVHIATRLRYMIRATSTSVSCLLPEIQLSGDAPIVEEMMRPFKKSASFLIAS